MADSPPVSDLVFIRPFKALRGELKKIIWDPFWWVIILAFVFWVPFLRVWWWVITPIVLSIELRTLYLWWIAWDFTYAKTKWVMLEIIPPKEVLTPLKAMEDVFTVMFNPLSDAADFAELWCEGELDNTPYWMSFEIVSIEGQVHFYARVMAQHRGTLEAALYSHYPELEIREASDYTKDVPQNIPNDEYDLYGEAHIFTEPAAYPIKTYEKFFEPQGEKISAEEKRIDSMSSLLETLSKLGPGEQYWFQIIFAGAHDFDAPDYRKEGKKILDELTGRPEKKHTTLWQELWTALINLVLGPKKEGSGEKATYVWRESSEPETEGERELLLSPGEREVVTEIENKMKKPVFRTTLRGMYIAKRDHWKGSHKTLSRAYLGHFGTHNLNSFIHDGATRTKVKDILRRRRVFYRARRMMRNAVLRFPAQFPNRKKSQVMLNTEELATLFHFPIKISALNFPTVERVEHRKGGPPANLPVTEE